MSNTLLNVPETDLYVDRNKVLCVGGTLYLPGNWSSLAEAFRTGKPRSGVNDDGCKLPKQEASE